MENKGKKIYVNGGLVIKTPFFSYRGAECLYEEASKDMEIMECDNEIDGYLCVIVDEEKAPSIFNEYYAKTGFSTNTSWAPFLYKSNEDNYEEYKCRIDEIYELTKIEDLSANTKQILFRQVYLGIVAAVETFVCDTILSKLSNSKDAFCKYINEKKLYKISDTIKEDLDRMWNKNEMGNAEQKVFDHVLKESYCDINKIKLIYKRLFKISICDINGKMKRHFQKRHLIAHKNGRKKNGEIDILCEKDIDGLISDTNGFVKLIMEKLAGVETETK